MCILLVCEKKLCNRVIYELCRVEIDGKTEILEFSSTFRYFGKGIALIRLKFALENKFDMPFAIKRMNNKVQPSFLRLCSLSLNLFFVCPCRKANCS